MDGNNAQANDILAAIVETLQKVTNYGSNPNDGPAGSNCSIMWPKATKLVTR